MMPANITLNVKPGKKVPFGFRKYFRISSAPPKREPMAGPNKYSTTRLGIPENPILI